MNAPLRLPKEGDTVGGHFRLHAEIGRGSFGVVYRAEQLGLDRPVAVKMLLPHVVTNEAIVDRFKREARLASSLKSPHSVAIHGFGDHDGVPYLVMEFLQGRDLRAYLSERNTLAVDEACAILQQALESLGEAHDLGIIHRDLKPENLFLSVAPEGGFRVKVLDFGIAKAIDGDWGQQTMVQLTREGMVCGTPEYMSPEQATGDPILTPGVDIYSMGCIAYEMVAGRRPYSGNSAMDVALKHLTHPLPRLQGELEGTFIEALIHRAMAKDYADRFQTVAEFSEAVEQAIEDNALRTTIGQPPRAMTSSVFQRALDRAAPPSSDKPVYRQGTAEEAVTDPDLPAVAPASRLERPLLLVAIAAGVMILGLMVVVMVVLTVYKPTSAQNTGGEPRAGDESPVAVVAEDSVAEAKPADDGEVVVEIASTPVGARVLDSADGELCVTPCSFKVDPAVDVHTFRLTKAGYEDGTALIDIRKGVYAAVVLNEKVRPPKVVPRTPRRRVPGNRNKARPVREPRLPPGDGAAPSEETRPPKKDKKDKKLDVPLWE